MLLDWEVANTICSLEHDHSPEVVQKCAFSGQTQRYVLLSSTVKRPSFLINEEFYRIACDIRRYPVISCDIQ